MPVRLADLRQDLRYGIRSLLKTPGFSAAALVTLALGIGANTSIFTMVDAALLRPLPYTDPDRLATVWDQHPQKSRLGFSAPRLFELTQKSIGLEHVAGFNRSGFNISGTGLPERVEGMSVSWDFFNTLGTYPYLGRAFREDEDRPGAPLVAVLSYSLWQRQFAGDPNVIGRSFKVNGRDCTIVGIMSPRFRFFGGPEMWVPMALNLMAGDPKVVYLSAIGRLKPGLSHAQATAQWGGLISPLRSTGVPGPEKELFILFGAVAFVLLIACVNVASLLLARSAGRRREIAVRGSLGATRGRILRQLLTESLILSLAGGLLGLVLVFWSVEFLPAVLSGLPDYAVMRVDGRVLGFTLALSLVTGLFFGALPAWRASRLDVNAALRAGGYAFTQGRKDAKFRSALVISEIALSFVLLVAAGLMIRSLVAMHRVDLGFRSDHVLTMRLSATEGHYTDPAQLRVFYRRVLAGAIAIPGVRAASLSVGMCPWDTSFASEFDLPGRPKASASEFRAAGVEVISPQYLDTMGMTLRAGRPFTERDDEAAAPVAIISKTLADTFLPGVDPIGKRIAVAEFRTLRTAGKPETREIVGVVADVRFGGPAARHVPILYLPMLQAPVTDAALALRTSGDPMSLAESARVMIAGLDAETPATKVRAMDQFVVDSMAKPRNQTWLFISFAALAVVLAALGNYGVMSYSVAQSSREIGIRMALGAKARDVVRAVLRNGVLRIAAGLVLGLGLALAATRFLSGLLFNVKPADAVTYAGVAILLGGVALAAVYIPARRITRVDPMLVLRQE
jgi:putative ABC transport system permease protein